MGTCYMNRKSYVLYIMPMFVYETLLLQVSVCIWGWQSVVTIY